VRVLLIKTSSMGDIIHTLPALTDAQQAIATIQVDWVVEESFTDIPTWHPAVNTIYPVAIRRWRKNVYQTWRNGEFKQFKRSIKEQDYDLIIDAQGLLKSAFLTRGLSAEVAGYDKDSAREPIASCFYQKRFQVAKDQHAVERIRDLFAQALGYQQPKTVGDYGLNHQQIAHTVTPLAESSYCIFLHGTTWPSKHWPEENWRKLAEYCQQQQQAVYLPWGNDAEYQRALRISDGLLNVHVLPKLSIAELAALFVSARACVAVDTGLGHLAAALDVPCISLYGPTLPDRVGAYGKGQIHLCASGDYAGRGDRQRACFDSLTATQVVDQLALLLARIKGKS